MLLNETLRIGVVHNPPFEEIIYDESGTRIVGYGGLSGNIVGHLQRELGFKAEFIKMSGFGSYKSSCNCYTAAVGDLASGRVDLAAMTFVISEKRHEFVDFLFPIYKDAYALAVSRKSLQREWGEWDLLTIPLRTNMWILLFLTLLLAAVVLFLMSRRHLVTHNVPHRLTSPWTSSKPVIYISEYVNCLIKCFGPLVRQSMRSNEENAVSWRVFASTYTGGGIILTIYYTASFTAIFSSPNKYSMPVNTLDDVEKDSKFKPIFLAKSAAIDILKSYGEIGLSVYDRRHEAKSNKELFGLLQNSSEPFVTISPRMRGMARNQMEYKRNQDCHIIASTRALRDTWVGFAIQTDSPYTEILNRMIIKLHGIGVIRKWMRDISPDLGPCTSLSTIPDSKRLADVLGLPDLVGLFLLLISGLTVSLVLFILEKLI